MNGIGNRVDAECAAYLALHAAEMRAELAAAAATWREGGR